LPGYTAYFQLLLAFVQRYPELQASANRRVKYFLKSEIYRKKRHCPSLGEWLIVLAISRFTWEEVGPTYLKENFDRNVKWVCEKHPELVDTAKMRPVVDFDAETAAILEKYEIHEPPKPGDRAKSYARLAEERADAKKARVLSVDKARLPKTFLATKVSIRLLLFHVYFLRTFRPYDPVTKGPLPLGAAQARLDRWYGRPSLALQEQFQVEIKRIKKVNTWRDFFARLGFPVPRDDYLVEWLQTSVKNSARKKYHDESLYRSHVSDIKFRRAQRKRARALAMISSEKGPETEVEAMERLLEDKMEANATVKGSKNRW